MSTRKWVSLREGTRDYPGIKNLKWNSNRVDQIVQAIKFDPDPEVLQKIADTNSQSARVTALRARAEIKGLLPAAPSKFLDGVSEGHTRALLYDQRHVELVEKFESHRGQKITPAAPGNLFEFFDYVVDLFDENEELIKKVNNLSSEPSSPHYKIDPGSDGDAAFYYPDISETHIDDTLGTGPVGEKLSLLEACNLANVEEEYLRDWLERQKIRRYKEGFAKTEVLTLCRALGGSEVRQMIAKVPYNDEDGYQFWNTREVGLIINNDVFVIEWHQNTYVGNPEDVVLELPQILWEEDAARAKLKYPWLRSLEH